MAKVPEKFYQNLSCRLKIMGMCLTQIEFSFPERKYDSVKLIEAEKNLLNEEKGK